MSNRQIDRATVRALLYYNPQTGELKWKRRAPALFVDPGAAARWNTRYAGKPAFAAKPSGYRIGKIYGRFFLAHRIIWLWMKGELPARKIYHKDRDRSNNRWSNLSLDGRLSAK